MDLLKHSPSYSIEQAAAILLEKYGIEGTLSPLDSERDQNFRVDASDGNQYVFKIFNSQEKEEILHAQHKLLTHLSHNFHKSPKVIHSLGGILSTAVDNFETRVVSYIPGTPLGNVNRQSLFLLKDLAKSLGEMDRQLVGFDDPGFHREFHWDLGRGFEEIEARRHLVTDLLQTQWLDQILQTFTDRVAPHLPNLRQSVIHSDANDYNVIFTTPADASNLYTKNQSIAGIIDYGDVVYSYTICNLAIAIAYTILDKKEPLKTAAEMAAAYHQEYALTEAELETLWGFILLRLGTSIVMAAAQMAVRPDDPYLAISQAPIRRTLPGLLETSYLFATATIRGACGLSPVPSATEVVDFINAQHKTFVPVMGEAITEQNTLVLDLSVGSPMVNGDSSKNSEPLFTSALFGEMDRSGKRYSIGRYDEPRLIYSAPFFKMGDGLLDERRCIHIGLDIFAPAETPIYAPLDGTVHLMRYTPGAQDFGHLIILAHQTDQGTPFYTLYGHLGAPSLEGKIEGQLIRAGEEVGVLGHPFENGEWPPHLHFQIITDLLGYGSEFPGVGNPSQRQIWHSISPDPEKLLNIPEGLIPPPPPNKQATLKTRKARLGPNLSLSYRDHLKMVRGWQQYLWDHEGRKYLDAYNNVPHVGHAHPAVIEAAYKQMGVLNTNTRYLQDQLNRYAEKLCATLPEPLSVCFFVNSASEANDLALRLMKAYTGSRETIVLEAAYHGHTSTLIDISPYKHDGPGGEGAPGWVHTAPVADPYRGPYKYGDRDAGSKYGNAVKAIIDRIEGAGNKLGGFIAESCPSVGGQIIFPDGYLKTVYEHVRQAGGLCIADDVQTGYGRLGSHFYGFEMQNVVPDMVILGKPIGNGHPIGALVTTPEIAAAFNNGMEFFSTFGGNTVSCAVGMAVLDVLENEGLQQQARHVGNHLLEEMRKLVDQYEIVGDVRGSGFFLGIEFVKDRETLEPAAEAASFVSNSMREYGVLMGTDGPYHNVVKIRPPMPFNFKDADYLLSTLEYVLKSDF
ncbi:MAG: aminotransferase class III-fold pyridoxal phosphate-dependent enzyme [Chloroflexota bacterium]